MAMRLYCERCATHEILTRMTIIPLDRNTIYAVCNLCGFALKPMGVGSGGDDDIYRKTV